MGFFSKLLDAQFPFAGPQSDISDVLNPIYDSIFHIVEDAIASKNEKIVRHALASMAQMALTTMSVVAIDVGGGQIAPLAYSASFYLDRAIRVTLAANMADAILGAIAGLQAILLRRPAGVDLTSMTSQANDTLFAIVIGGYAKNVRPFVFSSIRAMLLAVKSEIESGEFDDSAFRSLLSKCKDLTPLEVAADLKGERRLQVFPAYDLAFEASIPMLVQAIAQKACVDPERDWLDPFGELSEMMEIVRGHYRGLADVDFNDVLLRKWVVDSLDAILRVLFHQLVDPPEGAEDFTSTVSSDLNPQITWMSGFFPAGSRASKHHVTDATAQLTMLGVDALENAFSDIALTCAKTLRDIAANLQDGMNAYDLADIHVDLEILARASETMGDTKLSADIRAMILYPQYLASEKKAHYESARQTRLRQFEESLASAGSRYRSRNSPVERLHALIASRAA